MPQSIPIAFKKIGLPEIGHNNYAGFQPGKTEVLPKGWNGYNAKALESDIRVDHDVEFKARDGAILYADIYRPEGFEQEKLPAIISWSPYGKKYSALAMLPMCVWNCCVGKEKLSGKLTLFLWKLEDITSELSLTIRLQESKNSKEWTLRPGVLEDTQSSVSMLVEPVTATDTCTSWDPKMPKTATMSSKQLPSYPGATETLAWLATLHSPSSNGSLPLYNHPIWPQLLPGKALVTSTANNFAEAAGSR